MTKEEAITNLEMISVAFVEPVTKEQRKLIDDTFDMAIQALEQEPKTGHWIYIRNSEVNGLKIVKCSECGKEYDPHSSQFIKYCNECGARMFEPQEGSNKE